MASYHVSDSDYRSRAYNHAESPTYGRPYERVDPSVYGRSHAGTDPTVNYGGSNRTHGSERSLGSYPVTAHSSAWSTHRDYGTTGGNRHEQPMAAAYDRRGFDEYVTKVATEYIRPSRGLSPSGYGYSEYSSKEQYKTGSYHPVGAENYDSFSRKEYSSVVPTYAGSGTSRPIHGSWNASSGHPGQLSNPTTDIGVAVRYLDEAARRAAPTPKIHSYVGNSETVEPAKRYGSYNLFSRRSTWGWTVCSLESGPAIRLVNPIRCVC